MTRAAHGPIAELLEALEPAARAAWEADLLNLPQAIAASQAITDRRKVDVLDQQAWAAVDAARIQYAAADAAVRGALPADTVDRLSPPALP